MDAKFLSLKDLLMIAREINLSFEDYERISDELVRFVFKPLGGISWATAQILEDRFGKSLWNYRINPLDGSRCLLSVILRPLSFNL